MKVVKHSGDVVNFDAHKLRRSLQRSGADQGVVEEIIKAITASVYPGMSTADIFSTAFAMLRDHASHTAARYNLREAIRMLGPAGFYFEKYIGRLYSDLGFEVMMNLTLTGRCVSHEIDVATKKDEKVSIVECKFHAGRDARTDVKVPMYILSRFTDVKSVPQKVFSDYDEVSGCTIVTNNRFTSDAITFATCSGLDLLSWDYPAKDNLKTVNDGRNLYPVTALTTLSMAEKQILLQDDIILVRELHGQQRLLEGLGLHQDRLQKVFQEVEGLIKPKRS
jgi:hypothetical protein